MGTKLANVGAVAIKAETTVGTVETITATETCLLSDVKAHADVEMLPRNSLRNVAAPMAPLVGMKKFPFSCACDFRGSGTAGTERAELGALLKACGFTVATTASLVNRYTLDDNPSSGPGSVTAKYWRDGIYATGRGIRGNGVISLPAGKVATLKFDGQGALSAEGESATPSPPTDTPMPPICASGGAGIYEVNQTTRHKLADGVVEELRDGAASNLKLAIKITGSGKKLKYAVLKLKKNGTPANETNGLSLTVQGDAPGEPDGTPITSGTATAIATTQIETTAHWVWFEFATAPTLANSTVYWIVLEGDYDTSADNNVEWATDVVAAGSQISMFYDAAWAAVELKNFTAVCMEAVDTTVYMSDIEINPGAKVGFRMNQGSAEGIHSAVITGFEPVIKVEPLEMTDAEWNFYSYLTSRTELALRCDVGSTAGNKFQFKCLSCRRKSGGVEHGDVEGELSHPMELQVETPSDFYIESR